MIPVDKAEEEFPREAPAQARTKRLRRIAQSRALSARTSKGIKPSMPKFSWDKDDGQAT